jgi:hypothetical protein
LTPPSFTFNLNGNYIRVLRGAAKYLLEGHIGIVVGARREALL